MHLDDERIERLLHSELPVAADAPARMHMRDCGACRERVAVAEREEAAVLRLLQELDHEPPLVAAGDVMARARSATISASAPRGARSQWRRRAAGLLVALGIAGAAYALPGSPVPGWVDAVVERIGSLTRPSIPIAPEVTPGPAVAPPASGGIAVAPGPNLSIEFVQTQSAGAIEVLLTAGDDVLVRTAQGAATFTSEVDRLVVDNTGSGASFEIQIPRAAPRVEIRVAGRQVFLKEGARVLTEAADLRGSYLLPLEP